MSLDDTCQEALQHFWHEGIHPKCKQEFVAHVAILVSAPVQNFFDWCSFQHCFVWENPELLVARMEVPDPDKEAEGDDESKSANESG